MKRWQCDECWFSTLDEREAIGHAEDADHWLSERLRGRITRTMHASDYGGVYIDEVTSPASRWSRGGAG